MTNEALFPPALGTCLAPGAFVFGPVASCLIETGRALPLAGDPDVAFTGVTVYQRRTNGCVNRRAVPLEDLDRTSDAVVRALDAISRRRKTFAGFPLTPGLPLVMGIVNVTPDSFSDGGDFADGEAAIAHGLRLLDQGAHLLDIGGESTRPGSDAVSPEREIARVVPVVRELARRGAIISVDTRNARTMDAALKCGARIVNDITALKGDPQALSVIQRHRAAVIVMHMQGEPKTMQNAPTYDDAPLDIYDWLAERVDVCRKAGIPDDDICVDPGLGFGKSMSHNVSILADSGLLLGLNVSVLIAGSRKRFIGDLAGVEKPKDRLSGSLAVALKAAREGAQMVRVHDVAETVQALKVAYALDRSGRDV